MIETFDPAGIRVDNNVTLGWSSYYHKNDKKYVPGKQTTQERFNQKSLNSKGHHSDSFPPPSSQKPKPQLLQHQMQLKVLEELNQPLVSTHNNNPGKTPAEKIPTFLVSKDSSEDLINAQSKFSHTLKPNQRQYFGFSNLEREENHCPWNLIFTKTQESEAKQMLQKYCFGQPSMHPAFRANYSTVHLS